MRDLETTELGFVYGAGCSPCPPAPKKQKGNNGFGNGGGEPAPGNSVALAETNSTTSFVKAVKRCIEAVSSFGGAALCVFGQEACLRAAVQ